MYLQKETMYELWSHSWINKNYGKNFENLIADAGYESEENYDYLKRNNITPYIKPSNYEYSKTRKFQRDMEFRLAMEYMLLAFAFDMNKLHYRIQNHRIGQSLFPVKDTA